MLSRSRSKRTQRMKKGNEMNRTASRMTLNVAAAFEGLSFGKYLVQSSQTHRNTDPIRDDHAHQDCYLSKCAVRGWASVSSLAVVGITVAQALRAVRGGNVVIDYPGPVLCSDRMCAEKLTSLERLERLDTICFNTVMMRSKER